MLCVVSSTPRRLAYWWRMPPLASAVEPEQTVSRSRTITRPAPSRARWYAVLTPMMPAPTITTSALSVIGRHSTRRQPGPGGLLDAHLDSACHRAAFGFGGSFAAESSGLGHPSVRQGARPHAAAGPIARAARRPHRVRVLLHHHEMVL